MSKASESRSIDWEAATHVADTLGIRTRQLVAAQDVEAALQWVRQMERESFGQRAASYWELAVLLAGAYTSDETGS